MKVSMESTTPIQVSVQSEILMEVTNQIQMSMQNEVTTPPTNQVSLQHHMILRRRSFSDRADIQENLTGALNVISAVQTFSPLSLRVVLTEFGCGPHFATRTPAFVCFLGSLSPWVVCTAAGEYLSPLFPSCVSLIFAAVFGNTAVG